MKEQLVRLALALVLLRASMTWSKSIRLSSFQSTTRLLERPVGFAERTLRGDTAKYGHFRFVRK